MHNLINTGKTKRPIVKPPYSYSGSDDYLMAKQTFRHQFGIETHRVFVAMVPIIGMIEDAQARQLEQLDRKEFIARACNSHDDLVAALEKLCAINSRTAHPDTWFQAQYEAKAALKKAKGN